MRALLPRLLPGLLTAALVASAALASGPALAQGHGHGPARAATPAKPGPKPIGKFEDWQAATHQEGGQTACYAFTRARASSPALRGRGDVVLTVTERPGHRDSVAISAGFPFGRNAQASLQAGRQKVALYTSGRSAFAQDGHAAVAAFTRAAVAVATLAAPRGEVTDSFSLRGFAAAYAAITRACPAP
jgi:hypothetical protein